MGFDQLHPAVQHHIVNSLGWRSLRPLQEEAVAPLLAGEDAVLLAPTAGGKTEAAMFPLLSRMVAEDWRGVGILYVCPLRALLNNLAPRLEMYAGLLGRQVGVWHGDIPRSHRQRMLAEPPDVLLITPESLEAMLISATIDPRGFLSTVQSVVVDEVHAFAGDDRGWHLLAVLGRLERLAGRRFQRVGLSATVGNPHDLLTWLQAGGAVPGQVVAPVASVGGEDVPTDVRIDHVGKLEHAAHVIASLHRGEKRLVFVDSRARVESLAARLRGLEVQTYVSHSSVSVEERRQAEQAFAEDTNCVIVATSSLELGLDVGDLDRVIQVDAPTEVASFLQRLGRTGRRAGSVRNCLFLTTDDNAFLQAVGLCRLWQQGYVEPVVPPPQPYHLLAHQLLALALQEGQVGDTTWWEWLASVPGFAAMPRHERQAVVDHLVTTGMLRSEEGMLSMGPTGEDHFGRRHFLELTSVFTAPPEFTVMHGRTEVGRVHQRTFQVRTGGRSVLLLAGRPWAVLHLDWPKRIAQVEPATGDGKSTWIGGSRPQGGRLARSVRRVLADDAVPPWLTRRGQSKLEELRADYWWVKEGRTAYRRDDAGKPRWWTFAGFLANAQLAELLGPMADGTRRLDNHSIPLVEHVTVEGLRHVVSNAPPDVAAVLPPEIDQDAIDGLKFAEALPPRLARWVLAARSIEPASVELALAESVASVTE